MNALERWIYWHFTREFGQETGLMNLLQSEGIISDECVEAKDVCDGDAEKAVQWLDGTLAE